jgi:predicted nucleic acid-binding protein
MTDLPDTNAISAYLRGDNPRIIAKMAAAQALRLRATLVTRNIREFSRIPNLKGEN